MSTKTLKGLFTADQHNEHNDRYEELLDTVVVFCVTFEKPQVFVQLNE